MDEQLFEVVYSRRKTNNKVERGTTQVQGILGDKIFGLEEEMLEGGDKSIWEEHVLKDFNGGCSDGEVIRVNRRVIFQQALMRRHLLLWVWRTIGGLFASSPDEVRTSPISSPFDHSSFSFVSLTVSSGVGGGSRGGVSATFG